MYQEDWLPPDYEPFEELIVCGNKLLNGRVPFSVDGLVPLLVGKGAPPKVWLTMFTSSGLRPIVRAGVALHEDVTVQAPTPEVTVVTVKTDVVLEVQQTSENSAEIKRLNLRPVGLEVFGDRLSLHVGGSVFSGNIFKNVRTMIAIGQKFETTHPL